MYPSQIALTASLLAPLALVAPGAIATEKHEHEHDHEKRQHDAHVHGIAVLNLALEGPEVHVELDSPAANIVGFEHAPSSEADHAALGKAIAMLRDGDRLFRFNPEAGCRMEKAAVTSALLEEGHGHKEHEGEAHSDISAAYYFECDRPSNLTQLTVGLFDAFPGMEELNVQYVVESKQGAADLTAADYVIQF